MMAGLFQFVLLYILAHFSLVQGACWYAGDRFSKHTGYWQLKKCIYNECIGDNKWASKNVFNPKKDKYENLTCPTTGEVKAKYSTLPLEQDLDCKAPNSFKKGDIIKYIFGEQYIFESIEYIGPLPLVNYSGISQLSIFAKSGSNKLRKLKTLDIEMFETLYTFKKKFTADRLELKIEAFEKIACPKFIIRGCKVPTCVWCQYPQYCRAKPSKGISTEFSPSEIECRCPQGYALQKDGKSCKAEQVLDNCLNKTYCPGDLQHIMEWFKCNCGKGYELSSDKRTCVDINECKRGYCSQNCINTPGSYKCSCNSGFKLGKDRKTCRDINECKRGYCSQNCINTPGSYECSCNSGFMLGKDRKTCRDINECKLGYCTQNCINTQGSYECSCHPGFNLGKDRKTCEDIDECKEKNGGCQHICQNTYGSYSCMCNVGFQPSKDPRKCEDIDECQNSRCSHFCRNTVGSYVCSCKPGYKLKFKVRCEDINECLNATLNKCDPVSTICQNTYNTKNGYYCSCKKNYQRKDEYSCTEETCPGLVDFASRVITPKNCTKDGIIRRGTQCTVSCAVGYVSAVKTPVVLTCKDYGEWDKNEPRCKAVRCPALTNPPNGAFSPTRCIQGKATYKEKCELMCNQGYQRSGVVEFECDKYGNWNSQGKSICKKVALPPHLTCIQNFQVTLKPGMATANVTHLLIPPSVTNANVSDIKRLPSTFNPAKVPFGRTALKYVVKNSAGSDYCSLIIDVDDKEAPKVTFCPNNTVVKTGTNGQIVTWKEPQFSDNVKISRIEKTRPSGSNFELGETTVRYEAYDLNKNKGVCSFKVNVIKVECPTPTVKNGNVNCMKVSIMKICNQSCNKGYKLLGNIKTALCNNGFIGFFQKLSDCVPICPVGKYYDVKDGCKDCPTGKTTTKEGSIGLKSCA